MGTWGSGNFDNDSALDYMSEVEEELVKRIEDILADEERCALGEEGEGVLMPTVEMLSVLHEKCRLELPERETDKHGKLNTSLCSMMKLTGSILCQGIKRRVVPPSKLPS